MILLYPWYFSVPLPGIGKKHSPPLSTDTHLKVDTGKILGVTAYKMCTDRQTVFLIN
jgi:hypothetical protein